MTFDELRMSLKGVTYFTLPASRDPNRRFRFEGGKGSGKLSRRDPPDPSGVWTPFNGIIDGGAIILVELRQVC
jgi:hypothetical protein